jgi:transglutaminase-like putative cysteine protease
MELGQTQIIQTVNLTETTLQKLIALSNEQKSDPLIRRTIERIFRPIKEKDWTAEIKAIFGYVKSAMRYTRDICDVEYVKTPVRHILEYNTYGVTFGDCDDSSLLLSALLGAAGYKTRFVIIRSAGNPHNTFNHIYTEVLNPATREWLALDATMKDKPFGWTPTALAKRIFSV